MEGAAPGSASGPDHRTFDIAGRSWKPWDNMSTMKYNVAPLCAFSGNIYVPLSFPRKLMRPRHQETAKIKGRKKGNLRHPLKPFQYRLWSRGTASAEGSKGATGRIKRANEKAPSSLVPAASGPLRALIRPLFPFISTWATWPQGLSVDPLALFCAASALDQINRPARRIMLVRHYYYHIICATQ